MAAVSQIPQNTPGNWDIEIDDRTVTVWSAKASPRKCLHATYLRNNPHAIADAKLFAQAAATKDLLDRLTTAYFNGEEQALGNLFHEADDFLAQLAEVQA